MPISTRRERGSVGDHFASPVGVAEENLGTAWLSDESAAPKWRTWDDRWSVPVGRARSIEDRLVLSISPGEWIVIGATPAPDAVELTHVRAMFRLSGSGARAILEHVCAIDLGDQMTPNRAAARTLVAGVATELVRDDVGDEPSYLLLMSRSYARAVWDRLVSVGRPE